MEGKGEEQEQILSDDGINRKGRPLFTQRRNVNFVGVVDRVVPAVHPTRAHPRRHAEVFQIDFRPNLRLFFPVGGA